MLPQWRSVVNPLTDGVIGVAALEDGLLVVHSSQDWALLDGRGVTLELHTGLGEEPIVGVRGRSREELQLVRGAGPGYCLSTRHKGRDLRPLAFHTAHCFHPSGTSLACCQDWPQYRVCQYELGRQGWLLTRATSLPEPPLQLSLAGQHSSWLVSTHTAGFRLVRATGPAAGQQLSLALPRSTRNILAAGRAAVCLLSRDESLAVAGLRRQLHVWSVATQELLTSLEAHSGRIVEVAALPASNCVITSSLDKTLRVWDLSCVLAPVHTRPRLALPLQEVLVCREPDLAVTLTRSCLAVWCLLQGTVLHRLGAGGAVLTAACLTRAGSLVAAQQGWLTCWHLPHPASPAWRVETSGSSVVSLVECGELVLAAARLPSSLHLTAVQASTGEEVWQGEWEIAGQWRPPTVSPDSSLVAGLGLQSTRPALHLLEAGTGAVRAVVSLTQCAGLRELRGLVWLGEAGLAVLEQDRAQLYEVGARGRGRHLRCLPRYTGPATQCGGWGLAAPPRGGLELLDLRAEPGPGRILLSRPAQGVFTVRAAFTPSDRYILYWSSARAAITLWRRLDCQQLAHYTLQVPTLILWLWVWSSHAKHEVQCSYTKNASHNHQGSLVLVTQYEKRAGYICPSEQI